MITGAIIIIIIVVAATDLAGGGRAGRGRCVSIFLDRNRRYVGKSQPKRPPKRTQRPPHLRARSRSASRSSATCPRKQHISEIDYRPPFSGRSFAGELTRPIGLVDPGAGTAEHRAGLDVHL